MSAQNHTRCRLDLVSTGIYCVFNFKFPLHIVEFELGVGGHIPVLLWPDGETQYAFKQLHFHWGGRDCRGSEHTLGGRAFPLEVHMVHYNTSYGNFANAVDKVPDSPEGGEEVAGD